MRPRVFLRRGALSIAVLVSGVLAGGASASAATGPLAWGNPVAYPYTEGVFSSIACPSDSSCVAAGVGAGADVADVIASVAVESDGTWSATIPVTQFPGNADVAAADSTGTPLTSVSCSTATTCVAVGTYLNTAGGTDTMVVPITLGAGTAVVGAATEIMAPTPAASEASQNATLTGVSCNASACEAVGEYLDGSGDTVPMLAQLSQAAGVLSVTELTPAGLTPTPVSDIALVSISCPPSGGACEAVGNYLDTSGNDYPWIVQINGGSAGAPSNITMPAGFTPEPAAGTGAVVFNGISAVSCPTAGGCTAAGAFIDLLTETGIPYALPITNGTPGHAVSLSVPTSSVENTASVGGLSCADASDCVLTGVLGGGQETFSGYYTTETAGVWSAGTTLDAGTDSLLYALGCSSATNCVAYGLELGVGGLETFFVNSTATLSITTSSLPRATVGVPYSTTLQDTGGFGADQWFVSLGTLPAGLSLDSVTGVISGTPQVSGNSGFQVEVTKAGPPAATATAALALNVSPAAVSTPPTTPVTTAVKPQKAVATLVKVTDKGTKVSVTVRCTRAACAGKLTLTTVEHLSVSKAHAKAKTKTVTLAAADYSLASGRIKTVVLTLKGSAAKLLATHGELSANLSMKPSGSGSAIASRRISLKVAATAGKKKKK
jgi:large repetitive protein